MNTDFQSYADAFEALLQLSIVIGFLCFLIPIIFFITLWLNVRSIKKDIKSLVFLYKKEHNLDNITDISSKDSKKDRTAYYRVKF